MATIIRRTGKHGQLSFRVQIRRKGCGTQTATFAKLSDAKKWAQMTEGAVLEGRHFPVPEAKRRTLADLIDRYIMEILPPQKCIVHQEANPATSLVESTYRSLYAD